jgi:uncharacterized protein DUF3617
MRIHLGSTLMLALGLSWAVIGQSSSPMREGMWEVNSKLSFPGMGEGMPMKHQQCVTAAMIKDPQSAIPKMDNDCKVSNYKLAANVATYTLTCASPVEIVGNGEIRYAGPNAYTGTLTLGGQGASYTLSYEAKRIGDCPE